MPATKMHRRAIAATLLIASAPAAAGATTSCAAADRVPYEPRVFLGYACRDGQCAVHKAGFAWADRMGLTDAEACTEAEDDAFVEGCRAFVGQAATAEQSGFEWARDNELGDACLCSGAGPRFAAGCEAYVTGFGR